jgi:thymidine kinase
VPDDNWAIFVMRSDGSDPTQLTERGANDTSPLWSPDGRKLLFVSDRDGNREVYVMSADGSSQLNLTRDAAEDWTPCWSPDGERIASHSGYQTGAQAATSALDILAQVEPETSVVAIDEVQFYDWTVADICAQLANSGRRVIVAGLDQDFRGEPFGPMPLLLAQAEDVLKLQAICVRCGAPATRTQRLIDGRPAYYEDPVILVGASEVYEARCRACHQVPHRGAL